MGVLSPLPQFEFSQATAHQPEVQREFVRQIVATGKFWRNEKSQIMQLVAPGDYCLVERKQGLRSILESGEVLKLTGATDDNAYDVLWIWLTANKWKLPRLDPGKPWSPERPRSEFGALPARLVR
jgi:hypothetical protein